MDPALLKKLSETPVTIALNARQFRLLLEWLQVETLERTQELTPYKPIAKRTPKPCSTSRSLMAFLPRSRRPTGKWLKS